MASMEASNAARWHRGDILAYLPSCYAQLGLQCRKLKTNKRLVRVAGAKWKS